MSGSKRYTLQEVRNWLVEERLLGRLWTDPELERIRRHFNGETHHTGGNIYVVLVPLHNGNVIGISDECVCLYHSTKPNADPYDTFWNTQATEILSLVED
jgi:hypothetical protein